MGDTFYCDLNQISLNKERINPMSQAFHTTSVLNEDEKQLALIEQRENVEDWFFKLMIPAVFLFLIIGSIILLL